MSIIPGKNACIIWQDLPLPQHITTIQVAEGGGSGGSSPPTKLDRWEADLPSKFWIVIVIAFFHYKHLIAVHTITTNTIPTNSLLLYA